MLREVEKDALEQPSERWQGRDEAARILEPLKIKRRADLDLEASENTAAAEHVSSADQLPFPEQAACGGRRQCNRPVLPGAHVSHKVQGNRGVERIHGT